MKKQQGKGNNPLAHKFSNFYSIVEVIKHTRTKKTSIVKNNNGNYLIAKKIYINDAKAVNEVDLMRSISHPNIVAFHELFVEKEHIYLIEEFCEEGDLSFHIRRQIRKKKGLFPEEVIQKWLLQLLLAIQYLHNCKIMHRDIRPQNIFLTSRGDIKLGSFKLSKIFEGEQDLAITAIPSPYYMAPECVEQKKGYDFKIDIWAFGCIIFELCSLVPVFRTKNMVEMAKNILKGKREELPQAFSIDLNKIFQKCLAKNIQRPTSKQLLRLPYFLDFMKDIIAHKGQNKKLNVNNRIPIKRYKVHNQILENKKKTKGSPKFIDKNIQNNQLPQISQIGKPSEGEPSVIPRKNTSKELKREVSSRQRNRQSSKQKLKALNKRIQEKIRSQSKQKADNKNFYPSSPQVQNKDLTNLPIRRVSTEKKKSQKQRQRDEGIFKKSVQKKIKTEQTENYVKNKNMDPKLLPPPLLPKPPQKKIQKSEEQLNMDFSETKKKGQLEKQLANFRNVQKSQSEVKQSLHKIFEDLNIQEDEEEEFSFDLDDENLARLTLKEEADEGELVKTYKSKLAQLIKEINEKYHPDMQSIPQRTLEFDSNSFAQKF